MSGHSHWSQIKHKKALSDVKKGRVFSKISRMICLAAKKGANPQDNPHLRLAIEKAREVNMPSDNILRAIQKGGGAKEGEKMEEILYEAYGPGSVGLIIETITDNKNRTLAEIKNILSTYEARLAQPGSVKWNFSQDIKTREWNPKYEVQVPEKEHAKLESLFEALNEHEEIQEIYSNLKT